MALFAFGRTIDCRCGGRVGVRPRVRQIDPGGRPRFLADAMLGGLARWLRILGYDVAWDERIADATLVRRSLEEERVVLTRDRALGSQWRVEALVCLESEAPLAQLAELAARFDLAGRARPFTRCSRCNTELVTVSRDQARLAAPRRVIERHDRFQHCPSCGRLYWEGTHWERMRSTLENALHARLPDRTEARP